jgi:hypothetical protein
LGSVTGLPGYTSDFSPACCSMVEMGTFTG